MTDRGPTAETNEDVSGAGAEARTGPEGTNDPGSGRLGTIASSGVLLFVGTVTQLGINFTAKLLIARLLGPVDYGAVSLAVTVMISLAVVTLVGTDTGLGRFLPRFDAATRRRGVLVSAVRMVVPFSLVVGGGLVLLARPVATTVFGKPEVAPVLRAAGVGVPLVAILRLAVGGSRGMKQALPRVLLQNLAMPVVRFGLIAVALFLGAGAAGVAWAYVGGYAVVGVGAVYYLLWHTPLSAAVEARRMDRELLQFSAPLMITATMALVLSNVDILLLGALAPTGDVGVYNVAYPLASLLTVVLTSVAFLFMPVISELHAEGDREGMAITYQVVSKWVFVATLPPFLALITFPGVIVGMTFGDAYVAGAGALAVLAVGFFSHAVSGPAGNTLTAAGETRLVMYDNTLVALVNVVLNLLLIPRYSFLGAAVATTGGYLLMNGLYVGQLYRRLGVHPVRRTLAAPVVGATLLWTGLTWTVGAVTAVTPVVFAGVLVTYGVCYPLVIVALGGVERAELRLLERVEERTGLSLSRARPLIERIAE